MSDTPDSPERRLAPPPSAPFCTTHWTQVLAARGRSPEAREALRELCTAYYEPIVAFLARSERETEARDVAHEFFGALLNGDPLARVEREGGRFRSYLLGALKHFLSHRRARDSRLKRGGGAEPVQLTEGTDTSPGLSLSDKVTLTPDAAFDHAWATTLLARALAALRAECEADGKGASFDLLKPWLTGEATHGDQAEAARALGLEPGRLKSEVHRLKHRFRQLVKNEVAATLNDPTVVDEEMRALFSALAS
ncbi:MAG: sigma-70 family RNA polymerase sigma factor [Chthoniobacter sp.]|nr:sigma-70 family RNA polymerase sigma factor [Chthoniobacter sp.]